jgi:hypothetical protein
MFGVFDGLFKRIAAELLRGRSVNMTGEWSPVMTYENTDRRIDLVTYNGSTYGVRSGHLVYDAPPTTTAYWEVWAQKGASGGGGGGGSVVWEDFNISTIGVPYTGSLDAENIILFQYADCEGYYLIRFCGELVFTAVRIAINCSDALTDIIDSGYMVPVIVGGIPGRLEVLNGGTLSFTYYPDAALVGNVYVLDDFMIMVPKRV